MRRNSKAGGAVESLLPRRDGKLWPLGRRRAETLLVMQPSNRIAASPTRPAERRLRLLSDAALALGDIQTRSSD